MSLDARYILHYDLLPYLEPTPQKKDKEYLETNFGGEVLKIDRETYYWNKPKYTLLPEEVSNLSADQVLECCDCSIWKDVTPHH